MPEPTDEDDDERDGIEHGQRFADPEPLDIDLDDVLEALPHVDDPDQDPPGAAAAPVPPG